MKTEDSRQVIRLIKKAIKLIDKKYKIIHSFHEVPRYNDEPKFFQYSVKLYNTSLLSDSKESVEKFTGGAAMDKEKALMKALGEAVERYCLAIYKENQFIKASIKELKELNNSFLDPFLISAFSKRQLSSKNFKIFNFNENTKFNWVKGYSLARNRQLLVPAQLIYVPYKYFKGEKVIRLPITTGAASGFSLNDAIYRGFCEVVERDAFMITYLNKLPCGKVDLDLNEDLSSIKNYFQRYNLELYVFDITNNIEIPTFLAIIVDRTGFGPAVSLGLKTSLNYKEAIIGAIEESQHSRPWIRNCMLGTQKTKNKDSSGLEERGLFWSDKKMIKHLDFLLKNKNHKDISEILPKFSVNGFKKLDEILNIVKRHKLEVIFVDVTRPEIGKIGFKVVKVVIPQLQPLYLDENFKYLGCERLYSVPKALSYTQNKTKEENLNKIPHPFL